MDKEFKIKNLIPVPISFNIQVNSFLKEKSLFTLPNRNKQNKANSNDIVSLTRPSVGKVSSNAKLEVKVDLDPNLVEYIFYLSEECKLSLETKQATVDMLDYLLNFHLIAIKDNLSLALLTIIFICSKVSLKYILFIYFRFTM